MAAAKEAKETGVDEQSVPLSEYTREELAEAALDAARFGEEEDVRLLERLLAHEPALSAARDEQGRTPLHMAAANGHGSMVRMMLRLKPPPTPDLVNAEGSSALHFAASCGDSESIMLLIKAGWSPALRNKFGRKPIDEAWDQETSMQAQNMLLARDPDVDAVMGDQPDAALPPGEEDEFDAGVRAGVGSAAAAPGAAAAPRRGYSGAPSATGSAARAPAPRQPAGGAAKSQSPAALGERRVEIARSALAMVTGGQVIDFARAATMAQQVTVQRYQHWEVSGVVFPREYPPPEAGDGADVYAAADEAGEGEVTRKAIAKYFMRNSSIGRRLHPDGWLQLQAQFGTEDIPENHQVITKEQFCQLWSMCTREAVGGSKGGARQ